MFLKFFQNLDQSQISKIIKSISEKKTKKEENKHAIHIVDNNLILEPNTAPTQVLGF